MSINAIETKDTNRYPFGVITKSCVAGGVFGYAAKHLLPLTESEMDEDFKGAMAVIREQSNKAKASAIDTIRSIKDKTLAQDTFIKMVDTQVPEAGNKNMKRALSMKHIIEDAKLNNSNMLELKGLIANVNKKAGEMYKQCAKGYESAMKNKRATPIYVAAGAALGFFTGLGKSVVRPSSEA